MAPRQKTTRSSARQGTGLTLIDAPWRHVLFEQRGDASCFICRAIQANPRFDARNLLLVRRDRAVIMLNRYPYTMGGLMIAPVEHEGSFQKLTDETLSEAIRLIKHGMVILNKAVHPKGYNIGINQGVEAGAGLWHHLHIHLVPRYGADTNFMTTTAGSRVLAQDVDGMFKRLKRAQRELEKTNNETR